MKYDSILPLGRIRPVDTLISLSCNYQYARDCVAGPKRRLESPWSHWLTMNYWANTFMCTALLNTTRQSTMNTTFKQYT